MSKKKILIIVCLVVCIVVALVVFLLPKDKNIDIVSYTITFNTNGGSIVNNQNVLEGEKITKPSDPTKEGYTFDYWTYQDVEFDFNTSVKSNMTLTAKWTESKKEEKEFTITFDSDGGSAVAQQIIKEGSTVTKPSNPTKSGYEFKGWFINDNEYVFESLVSDNITLKAKWEKVSTGNTESKTNTSNNKNNNKNTSSSTNTTQYTVTFDSNGGSSVSSKKVNSGSKVSKPSDPTKNGYKFAGWTLSGKSYDFNSKVTGNITLVAKWTQKSYTVSASKVDEYSPDRILTVYEDGSKISVKQIKYTDGTVLCSGSKLSVSATDLAGVSNLKVVLNDGTTVDAVLK